MMIAYVELYILDGVKNHASGAIERREKFLFVPPPLVTF